MAESRDALTPLRARFLERVDAPRWWSAVAFSAPRTALAVALAAAPAAIVLAVALVGPSGLADNVTDKEAVRETFSRLASAVTTASAIAVSVASLTLGRELTGLESLRNKYNANLAFHERVRHAMGTGDPPLELGPFLSVALDAVQRCVAQARRAASAEDLATEVRGVTLEATLDAMDAAAGRAARALDAGGRSPQRILPALLEFDVLAADHRVRQLSRAPVSEDASGALDALRERLHDVVVGTDYAKTLELEWGLSRMSTAILTSFIPAITVAVAMMLGYGDGARGALGPTGAAALVAVALTVVLLPIAAFVSHLLRFVFVNQYTLPTGGFVLGPEEAGAWERTRGMGE